MKYPDDADHSGGGTSNGSATPTGPIPTMLEAVVRRLCVTATYNRDAILLAPHIVYTRHDEVYVDGVVIERAGKPPREEKIGSYKLAGLGALMLTGRGFTPSTLFDPHEPRYAGTTLMLVDRL